MPKHVVTTDGNQQQMKQSLMISERLSPCCDTKSYLCTTQNIDSEDSWLVCLPFLKPAILWTVFQHFKKMTWLRSMLQEYWLLFTYLAPSGSLCLIWAVAVDWCAVQVDTSTLDQWSHADFKCYRFLNTTKVRCKHPAELCNWRDIYLAQDTFHCVSYTMYVTNKASWISWVLPPFNQKQAFHSYGH